MKLIKSLAAVAAFTAMGLSANANAINIADGIKYTPAQCADLSQRVDAAYANYQANPGNFLLRHLYLNLSAEYGAYC